MAKESSAGLIFDIFPTRSLLRRGINKVFAHHVSDVDDPKEAFRASDKHEVMDEKVNQCHE